jgi:hypothetical protein
MRLPLAGMLLAGSLIIASAQAQVLRTLESPNPEAYGYFGTVAGAGDVNNDGCQDVVVGAMAESGGALDAGRAYVFRGNTGDLLFALQSPNAEANGSFGSTVSGAGDVNNDGYDDVIVGARWEDVDATANAGRAYIFNGQTGGVLHTLASPNVEGSGQFGNWVSGAGDVNSDGCDDVIVGAYYESGGAGRAYVFNGQTGGILYALESPNPEAAGCFGIGVSSAGDVNSDGYDDMIVGAWNEDGGAIDAGRAYIFSGDGGGLLHTLESPSPEGAGSFGHSVSGAGDVNNDGYDDVIVGAGNEDGGAAGAGKAHIFNGQTGGLVRTLQSPNSELSGGFGEWVSGAGDVNNDGNDDVIVGAHNEDGGAANAGRAYVHNGLLYRTLVSPDPEQDGYFGLFVSGAGDVNQDSYDDVILGAWAEDGGATDAGRAYILSGAMILSGSVVSGQLVLDWTPCDGAETYLVKGADNDPYFDPGSLLAVVYAPATTWTTSNGVGDPDHNWTFMVYARHHAIPFPLWVSNRFGEFDFSTAGGP